MQDVPFAEAGQEGHRAFGAIDQVSKKRIVQPRNSAPEMLALAQESVQPLTRQLEGLVRDLPDVELNNVRPKEIPRLGQKLPPDRRADTLTDYLGGRIVVDDPRMLDEVVRRLAQRYPNVEFDDFLDTARESGYRAIHMQVMLDNGMTAEIQIMPREIFNVLKIEHATYEKWRNRTNLTRGELRQRRADDAKAKAAYSQAYRQWQDRVESQFR